MPHVVTLVAGWGCLGLGLLFTLRAAWLIRVEKRLGRRPLAGEQFSGPELLAEGVAVALLGAGNLLGGRWVLLVLPAVAVILVLAIRLVVRWAKGPSRRSG